MKKFIYLTLLLILTRCADLVTTYFSTSDLKAEFNPIVSILGAGWITLIFSQIFFLILIIYALWVYTSKVIEVPGFDKGLALNKFISLFYFRNTKSFFKFFYKLPTNKNSFLYSMGYISTYSLIYWSIIVSISTALLLINNNYKNFYNSNKGWMWLYLIGLILVVFFLLGFLKTKYNHERYHNENNSQHNTSICNSRGRRASPRL